MPTGSPSRWRPHVPLLALVLQSGNGEASMAARHVAFLSMAQVILNMNSSHRAPVHHGETAGEQRLLTPRRYPHRVKMYLLVTR